MGIGYFIGAAVGYVLLSHQARMPVVVPVDRPVDRLIGNKEIEECMKQDGVFKAYRSDISGELNANCATPSKINFYR